MKTLLEVAKRCGIYLSMQKGGLCDTGPSEYGATKKNLLPLAAALPKDVPVGAAGERSALPMSHTGSLCPHHCCYYMAGASPRFPSLGMQSSWDWVCDAKWDSYGILLLCSLEQVGYFNLSSNVVLSSVSRGGNEIRRKPSDWRPNA